MYFINQSESSKKLYQPIREQYVPEPSNPRWVMSECCQEEEQEQLQCSWNKIKLYLDQSEISMVLYKPIRDKCGIISMSSQLK